MKTKIIDFLLNNADPSIVLRVKREILGFISDDEEHELISKIMMQKNVQTVLHSQKADGWFGNAFHGQSKRLGAGMYDNMEVGLRYLAEKGFPPENEYISKAIHSFFIKDPSDSAYGAAAPKPPATDYSYTASGIYLPRSSIIIRAGYEHRLPDDSFIDLKYDINYSFKSFANVLNYSDTSDVLDTHRRKLCFKPDILWPCLYDLRMLAFSDGWRNDANTTLLADSLNRLFSFSHTDDMVYTYIKGQYAGPCFAFINNQFKILDIFDDDYISLDMMELLARCSVIKHVPLLKSKYERLLSLLDDDLKMETNVIPKSGRDWSPYFGYALEENWKTAKKKQCDILFRLLLIIHYSEHV